MMQVVIIGSGAVAEAFVEAVSCCEGLNLVAVAGRNERRVEVLARCGVEAICDLSKLPSADIYIISVSDSAVGEVCREARFEAGSVVVHTAGSLSVDELHGVGNRGVIYPMQSFSVGRAVDFRRVPLFVEGDDPRIAELANSLSDNVLSIGGERRVELHLAAVFACNFVNAMFGAAHDILERRGVDFDLYKPLIEETIAKMMANKNPHHGQSGPAKRGDEVTMNRHMQELANDQQLSDIYRVVSSYITTKHSKDGKL